MSKTCWIVAFTLAIGFLALCWWFDHTYHELRGLPGTLGVLGLFVVTFRYGDKVLEWLKRHYG